MDKLVIIGAGGHGRVAADIAEKMQRWCELVFLDDSSELSDVSGISVVGNVASVCNHRNNADVFVAIGDNKLRSIILNNLLEESYSIATLIHPNAVVGRNVEIGNGSLLMAGAIVNVSSRLGKGCVINTSASVDHDNILEDYVHLGPGARTAGNVTLGEGVLLGMSSSVLNNIKIAAGTIIGAGAVVLRDLNVPGTYVGVPARVVRAVN